MYAPVPIALQFGMIGASPVTTGSLTKKVARIFFLFFVRYLQKGIIGGICRGKMWNIGIFPTSILHKTVTFILSIYTKNTFYMKTIDLSLKK